MSKDLAPNVQKAVTLSRTLGVFEVTLIGVGALIGGGIFTLLGHAAGLSGGGLMLSMVLGAAISFFNLNSYVALSTTFPEAGGGYLWVRDGLSDLQGFLSGWISWMAHTVACSLYATSCGIFVAELFFGIFHIPTLGLAAATWQLVFTILIVLIFGFVNYRGASLFGKVGGRISLLVLSILGLYILFGLKKIIFAPELFVQNFTPLLPFGFVGVIQAAGLFYIAFEGSEVQAQTGEETKDPSRTLKIGLFSSWAIVTVLYLLVSFVVIGATNGGGVPSWQLLGGAGERAIIESAKQILPFGYLLMVLAGILANIAALNATIFSSSRVLFAMARDKSVWQKLSKIHDKFFTPHYATVLSVVAIVLIAAFFPLKDIAGAANILFILLFFQLNLAYIQLRRKRPNVRWQYVVPGGNILPILAMALYMVLGVSLFCVSPVAIYFTVIWFLLGLVNYLAYTKREEKADRDREIRYGHTARFKEKTGYRIILPVPSGENYAEYGKLSMAVAESESGEVLALRIHEIPSSLPLSISFNQEKERRVLDEIESMAANEKINIDTRLVATRSVSDTILETVSAEDGDLLIMGWSGYVDSKGFIFGRNIDAVLRNTKCDLAVVKLCQPPLLAHKILLPISAEDNPNLRFTGKLATALMKKYNGELTVLFTMPKNLKRKARLKMKHIFDAKIKDLKIKTDILIKTKIVATDYVASTIIKEAESCDTILIPAGRRRLSESIGMGSMPEQVAKICRRNVIVARGYMGIIQPFFEYLKSRI